MQCALDIRLDNCEGAVERVLGRLRQRGFSLCTMNVDRSSDSSTYLVHLTIESLRPMEQAVKQLDKLFEVQSVKLYNQNREGIANNGYAQADKESTLKVCASV
jgi:acetolactate synthase regulatory subunit